MQGFTQINTVNKVWPSDKELIEVLLDMKLNGNDNTILIPTSDSNVISKALNQLYGMGFEIKEIIRASR